jgi:hypothetical protein
VTDGECKFFTEREIRGLTGAVEDLRDGREAVLRDWVERVRANQAMSTGKMLAEPLLLDHIPHLYEAILDRLEVSRSRDDADQFATVHGFTRRLSGYNIAETVLELLMLRRAVWAHLIAVGSRVEGAYAAMEQIDGMVDRAILSSLNAYLDPHAAIMTDPPGADEAERGDGSADDGVPELVESRSGNGRLG